MSQTQTHPIPLADLHLPSPPDVWPLAWGWWSAALIVILLLGLAYLLRQFYRKHHAHRTIRKLAFKHIHAAQSVTELNTILRQTALTYFPREKVAGLSGTDWLTFLDHQLPEQHRGFQAMSECWQQALYSHHQTDQTLEQCRTLTIRWVQQTCKASGAATMMGDKHV
ncbi:DUF4381 domain-containing protein (plasmid) [Photobacterium sp. GJ3]|uniref:DUF4381 domain-containing protein n=1 Tax=Photobacterium sp. GJ3 TaxID=2829502 RepID=UPI001B8C4D75|nr:DUF4381 domain-containing protein [Photobacterium sp. GJ3]QUJ69344.1 DUF4381 domain-containing protein [Photobacterium sp. GJ3]